MELEKNNIIDTAKIILFKDWFKKEDFKILSMHFKSFFILFFKIVGVLALRIVIICLLPISVFILSKLDYYARISSLKSWVKTIKKDKSFFSNDLYSELKSIIKNNPEYYKVIKTK